MYGRKMNVKVMDGSELPRYAHDGDAGFDMCLTDVNATRRISV